MLLKSDIRAASIFLGFVIFYVSCQTNCYALNNSMNPEEKGLYIAEEVARRDQGFGSTSNDTTMILSDKDGNQRRRYLKIRVLEQVEDGDKSVVIFQNPGDVKGTAFLSHAHKTGSDDQWLYLPAVRKVKRISSTNQSGPFMSSEFAYEDIAPREVEKYRYRYLKEGSVSGQNVFIVEAMPKNKDSGYSKIVNYIQKDKYIPLKAEFYSRGGKLKKTLLLSQYNEYKAKHWRAHHWQMLNHLTGKITVLEHSNFDFDSGFENSDFEKGRLGRLR